MLIPNDNIRRREGYLSVSLERAPQRTSVHVFNKFKQPLWMQSNAMKNLKLTSGCYVMINDGGMISLYRVVDLGRGEGGLMRHDGQGLEEMLMSADKTAVMDRTHDKLPALLDGQSIHRYWPNAAASNVKRIVYPEKLREDYLHYHDNRTVHMVCGSSDTWITGVPKADIPVKSPYVHQDVGSGEYVFHYFTDDVESLFAGDPHIKVIVGDVVPVDGSLGLDHPDGSKYIHVFNAVKYSAIEHPHISAHTFDSYRRKINDVIIATMHASQRRDIKEWHDLIGENANDIYVVDAYRDAVNPRY